VAVKIRLKRFGKIRAPYYRIVVADSRTKRDGRSIEEIGKYHPTENPSFIEVNSERALYWLGVGAQASPQVEAILKITGDWGTFKGEKGAKSTLQTKIAKVEFQADEKKKPVLRPKAERPVKVEAVAEAEPVAEVAPVVETVEPAVEPVEEPVVEAVVEPAADPVEDVAAEASVAEAAEAEPAEAEVEAVAEPEAEAVAEPEAEAVAEPEAKAAAEAEPEADKA
jgi:small subunit ribosomal protein S16